MKFTVEDILTKNFTRKIMGGLNPEEVAQFLQSIAESWEQKNKEFETR